MKNLAILVGRLGADPELKELQNSQTVARMSVATTFSYQKDTQRIERTEWHQVIVWNKQADACAKYLKKGALVYVEGRIQTRSWEEDDGTKRYRTEIVANDVRFLERAPERGQTSGDPPPPAPDYPGDIPF